MLAAVTFGERTARNYRIRGAASGWSVQGELRYDAASLAVTLQELLP